MLPINAFIASGDFCRLLMTFANSLDPDQARQNQAQQNVRPDLDPNCGHSDSIPERFFEKVKKKKKIIHNDKKHAKLPSMQRVNR